jgi:hypothetical protein
MDPFNKTLDQLNAEIARAASAYEVRWSWLALHRVSPVIAEKLDRQRDLYNAAKASGSISELRDQGEALIRGYRKAVQVMEEEREPEDNYLVGQDPATGWRIVIGHNPAQAQLGGEAEGCAWFTPDEIAALFAESRAAKLMLEVKRAFRGSSIANVKAV